MSSAAQNHLAEFYLVRNVIAHSTGMLRPPQVKSLPRGTSADDDELRVTKAFLSRMLDRIDNVVSALERHVEAKFYKSDS